MRDATVATASDRSVKDFVPTRLLAVLLVIAALAAGAVAILAAAGGAEGLVSGQPADPADYRIDSMDGFCWEPDVFNTSGQSRHFEFQLQVGQEPGKVMYSETHSATLAPGERAHLHVMDAYWSVTKMHFEVVALARTSGCTLHVFDRGVVHVDDKQ